MTLLNEEEKILEMFIFHMKMLKKIPCENLVVTWVKKDYNHKQEQCGK